ncbi:putative Holliday junction resolvase-like endonuclease [Weissella uvarum]|uniref:hypothetical protein n=1 Tax=Weissella uvarum TaxID=1479233 RepID=UPI001960F7D1|nr:hypothetical protein [Weissella uvarum]MBM7617848.1 putative Holliday junction resolvase-like endonuclease [Weissella uvarum]MCM0596154.1 hypothetical protein [Weissella uvarum]
MKNKTSDKFLLVLSVLMVFIAVLVFIAWMTNGVQMRHEIKSMRRDIKAYQKSIDKMERDANKSLYLEGNRLDAKKTSEVNADIKAMHLKDNWSNSKEYNRNRQKAKTFITDKQYFEDINDPDKDDQGESVIDGMELKSESSKADVFGTGEPNEWLIYTETLNNGNLGEMLNDEGHNSQALYQTKNDDQKINHIEYLGDVVKSVNSN